MISRRSFFKNTVLASAIVVSLPEMVVATAQKPNRQVSAKKRLILFQGDSITDSGRSKTEFGATMGQGYPLLVSCRLAANYPNQKLKFLNKGIAGHTLNEITTRWQTDTLEHNPDIISILIGVNDLSNFISGNKNASAEHFEKDYNTLLNNTLKTNPNIQFVLCEPFVFPVGYIKKQYDKYKAEITIRQHIVRNLAQKYNATFVPLQNALENASKNVPLDYWVYDGVHPTFAGHEMITREWISATQKLFV